MGLTLHHMERGYFALEGKMVAVLPMAKADVESVPDKDDELTTLKVRRRSHRLVSKIIALRGIAQQDFFEEEDVAQFLKHLLLEAVEREGEDLKGKKRK